VEVRSPSLVVTDVTDVTPSLLDSMNSLTDKPSEVTSPSLVVTEVAASNSLAWLEVTLETDTEATSRLTADTEVLDVRSEVFSDV
jgi:hypothetical protein